MITVRYAPAFSPGSRGIIMRTFGSLESFSFVAKATPSTELSGASLRPAIGARRSKEAGAAGATGATGATGSTGATGAAGGRDRRITRAGAGRGWLRAWCERAARSESIWWGTN